MRLLAKLRARTAAAGSRQIMYVSYSWAHVSLLGIEDVLEYINASLKPRITNMVKFIKQYLEKLYPRDDYKKLLELS